MEYRVRFLAGDRPFHHEFHSANTKGLEIGSKVRVCYRMEDPTCAFVPAFFNISL